MVSGELSCEMSDELGSYEWRYGLYVMLCYELFFKMIEIILEITGYYKHLFVQNSFLASCW